MADPKVKLKRSAVAGRIPSVDQVPLGELALNTWDGQLYASKNVGLGTTVVAINPWVVGTGTDSYNAYFTAGNVGIGLTVPTSTLHVSGDGLFTSTLTATDSELYTEFDITNNGTSAYQFASTGIGFTQNTDNPTLYLSRGKNYKFDVNASGHPFQIRSSLGGSAYDDGVVNNGAQVGVVTFKVPYDAPSLLYYQCTVHSGMNGKIYVIDAGVGPDVNVNTTGIITANSFVKTGGTSSEFLKADGSVDSSTYLTAESDTLDSVTGRGGVTSNNISVGMLTATAAVVGSAVTLNSGGVVAGLGTFNSFNTTQLSVTGVATVTSGGVLGNIQVGKTGANEIDTSSGGLTIDSNGGVVTVDDYLGVNQGLSVTGISTLGHTIAGSAVTMTSGGIVAGLATVNYINATHINAAGVITATSFIGDGSGLTGIVAGGSGVVVKDSGSLVGTAGTIDFGTNLSVSPISAGVVTVTASGGGGSGVGYFVQNSTGIHTTSSVGIGTTTASGAAADPNNTTILNAGIVTANYFYGDGSGLTGIVAASSGIIIRDSNSLVGTAATVNFGTGLSVTPVSAGIVTVNNLSRTSGVDRTTTSFTATAGQTTFTVSYEISNPIDVFLNGVRLRDTVDYAATSGTNIVLTSGAAASDSLVVIEYFATTGTTNEKHAVDRVVTEFTATAGQTTFSVTYTVGNIDVFFNGARLIASDYTATDGTSVVLTSAAAGGDQIVVVEYLVSTTGNGISGQTVTTFTATAGQTTFNVSYTLGTVQVYRNGIRLVEDSDYTANTGNTIVLTSAASGGDSVVVVESQGLFGSNQTGINTTSNLGIGTTSAYNALTVVGDANISGVLTATTLYGNGANLTGIQAGYFVQNQTGIHTTGNIGVGTTSAYDALTVVGNANVSGVVTATAFYGDGSNLQGVVSGVGVALSTYNVGYAQTTIEFIGSGVTVVSIGDTTQVTIEPGLVGAAKSVTSFTATAGQTAFNVDHSYGQENVFLNGVRLSESQYTTNGSTITLNDAASLGDILDIVVYLRGSDPNRNIEVNLRPPFNGITTAFTMYRGTSDTLFSPVDERQILVSLGGIVQQPGIAYTVGAGSSIFFSAAPGIAASCFITGLFSTQSGISTDATKIETQLYTPTGVQTSFTLTRGYEQNYLDVYVNGARLVNGQDYTATDSSTFSLTSPAQAGDTVEAVAFRTVGITSAVTAGISSNVDGNYVNTTNLNVTGISTFQGNIGIGTTNATAKITSATTSDDNLEIFRYIAGSNGPVIRMSHSYSDTIGGNELIPGTGGGYSLGRIDFRGSLGSGNWGVGGRLKFLAKGSTSASSLPTDFSLLLSPEGSTTPSEVVRVGSAGSVGVGTALPHSIVHLHSTDPAITMASDDAPDTYEQTVLMNNSGNFYVRTHDQTGTFVANDYLITKNASGATAHQFRVANSEVTRVTSDGLTFNGDTAAANALDDYEEGTFTPTISGSPTYTYQVGKYTKVGNLVSFTIFVDIETSASSASLIVYGLPFTSVNSTQQYYSFQGWANGWSTGGDDLQWLLSWNTTFIAAYNIPSSGTATARNATDLGTSGNFIITGHYYTAA